MTKLAYYFTRISLIDKANKIGKGSRIMKASVESLNLQIKEDEGWDNEVYMLQREVLCMPTSTDSWYNDLKYYLTHGSSPSHLDA